MLSIHRRLMNFSTLSGLILMGNHVEAEGLLHHKAREASYRDTTTSTVPVTLYGLAPLSVAPVATYAVAPMTFATYSLMPVSTVTSTMPSISTLETGPRRSASRRWPRQTAAAPCRSWNRWREKETGECSGRRRRERGPRRSRWLSFRQPPSIRRSRRSPAPRECPPACLSISCAGRCDPDSVMRRREASGWWSATGSVSFLSERCKAG